MQMNVVQLSNERLKRYLEEIKINDENFHIELEKIDKQFNKKEVPLIFSPIPICRRGIINVNLHPANCTTRMIKMFC